MSRRNFRRFRPNVPLVAGSRRPTDKELIYVSQTFTSSNTSTTLKTTTFPYTIVGLRWNMSAIHTFSTGNSIVNWIIVVVHDGNSANTISQSNGADMYTPEQDVMAFGTLTLMDADAGFGSTTKPIMGSTKTMRKLKQGDLLQFITLCNNANAGTINGVVQFFCKS